MYSTTISNSTLNTQSSQNAPLNPLFKNDDTEIPKQAFFIPTTYVDDILLADKNCIEQKSKSQKKLVCQICKRHLKFQWEELIENLNRKKPEVCKFAHEKRNEALAKRPQASIYQEQFLQLDVPWYVQNVRNQKSRPPYERFYCYQKIILSLEYGFNDLRKIVDYAADAINLFHINLKIGTHKIHTQTIESINKANRKLDQDLDVDFQLATILEIAHKKLRTGLINHCGTVFIDKNSKFVITGDRRFSHNGTHEYVYVNFSDYVPRLKCGGIIKIGKEIQVIIKNILVRSIICKVVKDGLLKSNQSVQLPLESHSKLIEVTEEERNDVEFALKGGADYILCAFEENSNFFKYLHWEIAKKQRGVRVLGKISPNSENLSTDTIDYILQFFSGLWLDGDIIEKSPFDAFLLGKCLKFGKIIIRSGKFIKSEHVHLPDDEATLMSAFLYPDCIAISNVENGVVKTSNIRSIISTNYPDMNWKTLEYCCNKTMKASANMENIFVKNVVLTSILNQATCIIVIDNNGRTAKLISQHRPVVPILANVREKSVAANLAIWKNIIPLVYLEPCLSSWEIELNMRLDYSINFGNRMGFISTQEPFIVCFDSKRKRSFTDSFRILRINANRTLTSSANWITI